MRDGFDLLTHDAFASVPYGSEPPYDERFYVLFDRRRGLLVTVETYARGSVDRPDGSVNMVKVYFNWRARTKDDWPEGRSGRGVEDPAPLYAGKPSEYNPEGKVYAKVGDFDGREGLFSRLQWMEEHGQFITPWLEQPFMWLLTYADSKVEGYDHKVITAARLAALPDDVRAVIRA